MTIDKKKLKEAAFNVSEFPEAKWAVKAFREAATPLAIRELLARLEKAEEDARRYRYFKTSAGGVMLLGAEKLAKLDGWIDEAMKDQSC